MGPLPVSKLRRDLETLYERYHRIEYRAYDPVEVVWGYQAPEDQEIAGLWAALFAWGRREVALRKVRTLLDALGDSPAYALRTGIPLSVSWSHRTWSPMDMQTLWERLRQIYHKEGSLRDFFWKRRRDWESAIADFQEVMGAPPLHRHIGNLRRGSASKRLLLWLRWMIRRDRIDPGPWEGFSPRLLYMPIDVHVGLWARQHGLLTASAPTWRHVRQLTAIFRQIQPSDPLRYDFAIVTAGSRTTFAL